MNFTGVEAKKYYIINKRRGLKRARKWIGREKKRWSKGIHSVRVWVCRRRIFLKKVRGIKVRGMGVLCGNRDMSSLG